MALRPRVQQVNLENSSEAQCTLAKFLEGKNTGFFSKMFGGKSGILEENPVLLWIIGHIVQLTIFITAN
jgi:hypothetical protein